MSDENTRSDRGAPEPTRTASGGGLAGEPPSPAEVGQHIGSYKIIEVLGRGGMGVVYLAEQDKPRRTVALKVIRPGVATPNLLKRFEHEAQILGRLTHPGIAQVYEAGTHRIETSRDREGAVITETVPFFAMELVKGVPLTEFAEANKLGTRARLELLVKVCDAVQHAHVKGVIHRDLKPGNILVTEEGQPKILDFGVARATDADIQTTTLQTDIGQLIGTIPYMSPEQAVGDPRELDTRSDVYALGVVAYELLAGRLPYDLKNKMIHEAVRVIREDDPTPLSSVNRTLRGDVEIIVSKALEKDKSRRYQSAADLAGDIRRHLNDEAIVARPPSAIYQLRKFAKRNKVLVGGVAAVFVVLLAGVVVSTTQYVQAQAAWNEAERARQAEVEQRRLAETQRDRAVAAEQQQSRERERAEQALAEAERQAAIARAVNDFLNDDLLASVSPEEQGREVTMREMLDNASRAVKGKFEGQPLIEASIHTTLGNTYKALGEYKLAEPHVQRALRLRRAELGTEHADTLKSTGYLGQLCWKQGRYAEAESLLVETLELQRRVLGEEHADTLLSMSNLAVLYEKQGRYAEAEPLAVGAMEGSRRLLGAEHRETLIHMSNLALLYNNQGKYAKAELLYVQALEIQRRVRGEEHPDTLSSINNLAGLYEDQGRHAEAEPLLVQALELSRRVLGEEHPHTLTYMGNLAVLYDRQGRYDQAEPLYVQALELSRRVLGEEHPDTLRATNNLAVLYYKLGRYADAEPLYERALELQSRVLGEEHPNTLTLMNNLAGLYQKQDRYAKAEPLYERTLELRRRVLGEEHPDTLLSMNNLGLLYRYQGRYEEAAALYVETLQLTRRVFGEGHPNTLFLMSNLAGLHNAQGRFDKGELLLAEAVDRARRSLPEGSWVTGAVLVTHGACLSKLERYDEAEVVLLEAHQILSVAPGAEGEPTVEAIESLVQLYEAWGKPEQAAQWRAKAPSTQPADQGE